MHLTDGVCGAARQDNYKSVRDAYVKAAGQLKWGDPKDTETFIGPLISEKEAKRVEEWVQEAVKRGAPPVGSKRTAWVPHRTAHSLGIKLHSLSGQGCEKVL